MKTMVDLAPDFLTLLCCPVSRKPLVQQGDWLVSTDSETRLRYPIRDEIPVLLREESEELDLESWKAVMASQEGASASAEEGS